MGDGVVPMSEIAGNHEPGDGEEEPGKTAHTLQKKWQIHLQNCISTEKLQICLTKSVTSKRLKLKHCLEHIVCDYICTKIQGWPSVCKLRKVYLNVVNLLL